MYHQVGKFIQLLSSDIVFLFVQHHISLAGKRAIYIAKFTKFCRIFLVHMDVLVEPPIHAASGL